MLADWQCTDYLHFVISCWQLLNLEVKQVNDSEASKASELSQIRLLSTCAISCQKISQSLLIFWKMSEKITSAFLIIFSLRIVIILQYDDNHNFCSMLSISLITVRLRKHILTHDHGFRDYQHHHLSVKCLTCTLGPKEVNYLRTNVATKT